MPRNHQRGQQALARLVRAPVRAAWDDLVDPEDLSGTLPQFKAATGAVVARYGLASGAAALRYYRTARQAAGVAGRPTLTVAPTDSARLDASIGWATKDLWTPSPLGTLIDAAVEAISVTAERAVLNAGRDTLIGAVAADPKATGWARVAEGDACFFCAMLTTAGAHYKGEDTAGFEAHDHCACSVEAVFDDSYKPPPDVQAWQDLYADATRGFDGEDAINAFRRAYERPDESDQ